MKELDSHKSTLNSFTNRIILINATLRSHWTLSNSEADPRIWTGVTRPSLARIYRVWARDYRLQTYAESHMLSSET